jgi:hypothetical protein
LLSVFSFLPQRAKAKEKRFSVGALFNASSLFFKGNSSDTFDKNGLGYNLSLGYKFADHIGVELGYKGGKNSEKTFNPVSTQLEWTAVEANFLYYFNREKIGNLEGQLFILAGAAQYKGTANIEISTISIELSETEIAPQVGFGSKLYFNEAIAAKFALKYIKLDMDGLMKGSFDAGLGVEFNF